MNLNLTRNIDRFLGGMIVAILFPAVRAVGFLLNKKHNLESVTTITFVKLLGGGSLSMLLPAVNALKEKNPNIRLNLVCSQNIVSFAKAYGVFDQIVVIENASIFKTLVSGIKVWFWLLKNAEVTVDLEVHSRMSTILTTVALVRTRVGLVDGKSLWRKRLYTHAIYVNPFSAIYDGYDAVAALFGLKRLSTVQASQKFHALIKSFPFSEKFPKKTVVLGVGCSDLGVNRELPIKFWVEHLVEIGKNNPHSRIIFLGNGRDRQISQKIIQELVQHSAQGEVVKRIADLCGETTLLESFQILSEAELFCGIDSALLHVARLLKIPVIGFWGPTLPNSLMRPLQQKEFHYYKGLSCSPCIHITEEPPCGTHNICMFHKPNPKIWDLLNKESQNRTRNQSEVLCFDPDGSSRTLSFEVEL